MVKHISKLWWLIMAWLLCVIGENFWQFNVLEVFATIAIIVGVGWTIKRHFQERSRVTSLITYPDTWKAYRMLSKESFEVWVDIDILLPYNSRFITLYVRTAGKHLKMENIEATSIMDSKTGRVRVTGNTPLALLSADAKEVELWTKITLDGVIHRKSKKRTVFITNHGVTQSTPYKEGSET